MMFKIKPTWNSKEWWKRFAFFPTKMDENGAYVWLEFYEQRLIKAKWLSDDGLIPLDGAAAFTFERRRASGEIGVVKKYQID